MKTSAKDGSPITDCSLKTAILRTESSSAPRRWTMSGMLMFGSISSKDRGRGGGGHAT